MGATPSNSRFLAEPGGSSGRLTPTAAHYVLGLFGPPCDLRRWGESLMQGAGTNAKKRAVVAVARKLAGVLHRLWVTGAAYEPVRAIA